MITHPEIDYKKEFYKLLREIVMLESTCLNDRCPLARHCCVMCKLLKEKVNNTKNRLMCAGKLEENGNN